MPRLAGPFLITMLQWEALWAEEVKFTAAWRPAGTAAGSQLACVVVCRTCCPTGRSSPRSVKATHQHFYTGPSVTCHLAASVAISALPLLQALHLRASMEAPAKHDLSFTFLHPQNANPPTLSDCLRQTTGVSC